jgi:UrcA family protein
MKKLSLTHSLSMMGLAVSVLATATPAGASAAAHDTMHDTRTVSVRYAEAELASAEGVQGLYEKLERASRQACRRPDGRSLAARADWRSCRSAALDAAVAEVKNVGLSALHRERSGAMASNDALMAAVESAQEGH